VGKRRDVGPRRPSRSHSPADSLRPTGLQNGRAGSTDTWTKYRLCCPPRKIELVHQLGVRKIARNSRPRKTTQLARKESPLLGPTLCTSPAMGNASETTMQGDGPRLAAETSAAPSETSATTVPAAAAAAAGAAATATATATATTSASLPPYRQIRALHDADTITVYQAYSRAIATAAAQTQRLNASPDFSPRRMTWVKPSWCWMMYRSGYAGKDSRQAHILAIKMRKTDFVGLLRRAVLSHGKGARGGGDGGGGGGSSSSSSQPRTLAGGEGGGHAGGGGGDDLTAGGVGAGAEEVDKGPSREDESSDEETKESEPSRRMGSKPGGRKGPRPPKTTNVVVQWDPERSPSLQRLPYRSIQIGIPAALSAQWVEEWIVGIEDVTERAKELKKCVDEDPSVTLDELVRRGLMPTETEFVVPDDVQDLLEMRDRGE
jgi:hypothetical protein